ncbi:sigma 54-interacting transcriptional regulator [Polyangium aurulentum]|uniref:sigma 54-interacting transcriptional regulator n=1 Tax=Polyangium aurulentum TaxID=2567896 RepID=UPI0010AE5736|nr:sigma 54-interacting transcriptional regulator [Polyangium aurulentum]UQA60261.1 sigma 54-interacting transcriptional regulator [Polyangium aurulentum]
MANLPDGTRETLNLRLDELEALSRRGRVLLLLVYHREGVSSVPLYPGRPIILGRKPPPGPSGVAVHEPSLSREHARFDLTDAGDIVTVKDLGSTNGTWVRGQRIQEAQLSPGDEVRMGTVHVVVHGGAYARAVSSPLSHERFRMALEDEVVRARFFRRPFALLMLRAEGPSGGHVSSFHSGVSSALRPVDRLAFYGPDTLEVLVPEANREEAVTMVEGILGSARAVSPGLVGGIAVFPDAAGEPEALLEACRKAVLAASPKERRVHVAESSTRLAGEGPADVMKGGLVAGGEAVRNILKQVPLLARSNIPVLILGETGVGKEVLAHRIHADGPRKDKPLVIVNCAAIPETLVEATLFGHEKGAFTGALQRQRGLFESADGGTLLLDEVGDLPKASQAALLRVLETRKLRRVGATSEIEVDVRILAATHRDLEEMANRGDFRSDLLYRLSGVPITIPPLRARTDEIEPLCLAFLRRASKANGRGIHGVEPSALDLLRAYPWPGNIRELRNAIERAVVLAQSDRITVEDLPERVRHYAEPSLGAVDKVPEPSLPGRASEPSVPEIDLRATLPPRASTAPPSMSAEPPPSSEPEEPDLSDDGLRSKLERYEIRIIVDALNACSGNQRLAAERLGLPLRTLVHKMAKLNIRRGHFEDPGASRRR